jgi:6-phosphogluconolactonase (cycloisomerase 2 family)
VSGQGLIKVFQVGEDGLPSANYVSTPTQNPVPFSFTFDLYGYLVVVDAGASLVTSYSLQNDGSLSVNSSIATGQAATCWIASNGKYLFTDNTGAGNLSAIRTTSDGALSFINSNPVAISTGSGTLPIDMAVSHNGKFLYSLETGLGSVGMFRIGSNGSLTSLGVIDGFPPIGAQGIAAW